MAVPGEQMGQGWMVVMVVELGGRGGEFPGDLGEVEGRVGRGGRGKGRESGWGLQGPRSVDSVTQV